LNWKLLERPVHSADLALPDFCIFEPSSNTQTGRKFVNDDEVKRAVYERLHKWPNTFLSRGIKKLADRSAKCNEKKGNCIEK
jgi:hypothetical protein